MPQVVAVMMPCESTRAAGHQGDINIMKHVHTDMQPSKAYSAALYSCCALLAEVQQGSLQDFSTYRMMCFLVSMLGRYSQLQDVLGDSTLGMASKTMLTMHQCI